MTIMDGGDGNTAAAYDASTRKLVLVTMNYDTAQTITYDVSGFYKPDGPVRRWITVTGSGAKYAVAGAPALVNKSFSAYFRANTIQTFEVLNVEVNSPLALEIARGAGDGQILLS